MIVGLKCQELGFKSRWVQPEKWLKSSQMINSKAMSTHYHHIVHASAVQEILTSQR